MAASAALIGGCSDSTPDDDGYSGADWASEQPRCADLWVEGNVLPDDYQGCIKDDGGLAVANARVCAQGSGDLVSYDGLFARQGGEVFAGERESPEYLQAYEDCS